MSMTLTCEATAPSAPASNSRPTLLARFFAAVAREIRIRRDMRLLASFDDAALHDIGLVRGGMEDVVRHGRENGQSASGQTLIDARIMPAAFTEWR